MPKKSYEWTDVDVETAHAIDRIISAANMTNRGVAEKLDNAVSYSRIRDLRLGLKAPARLSEWVSICRVCGVNPADALQDVLNIADAAEADEAAAVMAEAIADAEREARARWIAAHPGLVAKAAKTGNIDAEQAAYEEQP